MRAINQAMRDAYRAGKYRFNAPPVCTARWDDDAWIRYIDNGGGKWTCDTSEPDAAPIAPSMPRCKDFETVCTMCSPGARSRNYCLTCQRWTCPHIRHSTMGHDTPPEEPDDSGPSAAEERAYDAREEMTRGTEPNAADSTRGLTPSTDSTRVIAVQPNGTIACAACYATSAELRRDTVKKRDLLPTDSFCDHCGGAFRRAGVADSTRGLTPPTARSGLTPYDALDVAREECRALGFPPAGYVRPSGDAPEAALNPARRRDAPTAARSAPSAPARKGRVRAIKDERDALRAALRDCLGFLDTNGVRAYWQRQGNVAPYDAVVTAGRRALRYE